MTRTQAQIDGGTAPNYEWAFTFYKCQNPAFTMGEDFRFHGEWDGIITAGDYFAYGMFLYCSGAAFTMNSVFNLPQGITTAGIGFAYSMFTYCSGEAFTMNSVFNLPQGITAPGDHFAHEMFAVCSGVAFTMNSVFNLPQGITTAGSDFAQTMFSNCSGAAFLVNTVFRFPEAGSFGTYAFYGTFRLGSGAKAQTRTAASIINVRPAPSGDMSTFGPAGAWSDYSSIDPNWQGW
jgi:hypothetical protein